MTTTTARLRALALALTLPAILLPGSAHAAPQLYDTGPAQDAALIRFVNGTDAAILVESGAAAHARLSIPPSAPITAYQAAATAAPITGAWLQGAARQPIALSIKAGGTASVVAWQAAGRTLASTVFSEAASRFDPLHASLAFYAVGSQCVHPGLVAMPRHTVIFDDQAAPATAPQVLRRALNPVLLTVQASCDGHPVGTALELGQLQAGQRYSVFLIPAGAGSRLIGSQDHIGY